MARNEDGEFELVVGNRQLLTIVFIIFVLCGIVFTMGYFVGRNSGPPLPVSAKESGAGQNGLAAKPSAAAEPDPAANTQLPPGGFAVAEQPQQAPAATPEPAKQTETAVAQPVKHVAEAPAPARQAPSEPAAAADGLPAPGTYVQVASVSRTVAETIADVLKRKKFRAFVTPAPVSKPGLFRVLVGPVDGGPPEIARLKGEIEAAGFPRTTVAKY